MVRLLYGEVSAPKMEDNRAYPSCVILPGDRLISCALGRPRILDDDDIDVEQPSICAELVSRVSLFDDYMDTNTLRCTSMTLDLPLGCYVTLQSARLKVE